MVVTDNARVFTVSELHSIYNEIEKNIGIISDLKVSVIDCAGPSLYITYKEDGIEREIVHNDPTGKFIITQLSFIGKLLSVSCS